MMICLLSLFQPHLNVHVRFGDNCAFLPHLSEIKLLYFPCILGLPLGGFLLTCLDLDLGYPLCRFPDLLKHADILAPEHKEFNQKIYCA
jgi:hypothetical protein